MRSIIGYFLLVAVFVWVASAGGLDDVERTRLPISYSTPPTYVSDLPLPDPHKLNDLDVVPAAKAADAFSRETISVIGVVVNLRAGPGLHYRMIDVAEQGDVMEINGASSGSWVPVRDPVTGLSAWIHVAYVDLDEQGETFTR